jgi:hypothetical protein
MKVIFRKFKRGTYRITGGEVIAFLPEIKEVNPGMMMSYMHIRLSSSISQTTRRTFSLAIA